MSMTHYPDGTYAWIKRPHPKFNPVRAGEGEPRRFKIYRNRKGWPRWYQRWIEAWWIITGKWSLHRAWQDGLDYGAQTEFTRTIINGGR